ncbi:MAG: polysaccharide biosynthesis tyrosine autokinase [Bacteroidales bacterium]|nr:polysaccharide biosynthesis tyrosine autokinase [Bacteroidales bacterium]
MQDNNTQQNINTQSESRAEETEGGLDFQTIVNIFLGKWYVFVICVFISLCIAAAYIWKSPKAYVQYATVLVKDPKTGTVATMSAAFADIAGFTGMSNTNVQNEQHIITSRTVMRGVVKRLSLQYGYYKPNFMRKDELYVASPVFIEPVDPEMPIPGAAFKVKFFSPQDTVKFEYESEDTTFVCPFNKEVDLPGIGPAFVRIRPRTFERYVSEKSDYVYVFARNLELATTAYLNSLSASMADKESSTLNLSYTASSSRKAADILNTVIDEYNRITIESKNEVLDGSLRFIAQRIDVVGAELNEVDAKLEDMKSSEKTINPMTEASSYLTLTHNQEVQLSELEVQLRLIKELRSVLDTIKYSMLPLNVGISSQVLNTQIQRYDEGLLRYNQLRTYSSDKSPVVLDRAAALDVLLDNIKLTSADVQNSLEMQIGEINKLSQRNMSRVSEATSNVRALTSIEREQAVKSALYNYLLQKTEENAIMKSMTESNVRLIDSAFGNNFPVSPKKMRIMLLAFALGLIIPFAFYYLKDILYTKVRGRSDVSAVVKAPIVGEIPSKPKKQANQTLFVEAGANNQISESFRILRANLSFMATSGQKQQVISLTSTMAGEGKSYIAVNLAMAYAISGKKVCLVDIDLRKMASSRFFKMRGKKGVSEYLAAQEDDLSTLVQATPYENVSILPGGVIPPNPAELLMSDRFDKVIEYLRERFDYIILDNPPLGIVADTGIANRVADLTLYVMRVGYLDRRQLPAVQDVYTSHQLRNMAVVLTDIDYEVLNYSMGYTGYGKYYGYRYYGHTYYNYYASYSEGESEHKHSYGLYRKKSKK